MFCISCMKPITDDYWEIHWYAGSVPMYRGPYHDPGEIDPVKGLTYEIHHHSLDEDRWEDEAPGGIS